MNANRKRVIDFGIMTKTPSGKFVTRHDHFINRKQDRHVQPHQPKCAATKPYKLYHKKGDK